MIDKSRLRALKNVAGAWLGLGTSVLVGFFLTPFVLHHVGDTSFGIWILLTAFTGYYGLLDLGLRTATIRYVARSDATNDTAELNRIVSTSFFFYICLSLVMMLVTAVVYLLFERLFHVGPEWQRTGRLLLLVVGFGTAVTTPFTFFSSVLEGLQRFSAVGWVQTASALIRAALLVVLLNDGYQILGVGVITVIMNFLSAIVLTSITFRAAPSLRIRWSSAGMDTFRTLRTYGVMGFWISIAQSLRFQLSSIVIGRMISAEAITFFSNGSRLSVYSIDIVQMMAQIFVPMASAADAVKKDDWQRRLFVISNRYSAFLALPLGIMFIVMGQTILRAWVGEKYVAEGYSVLVILTVPMTIHLMQAGSPKLLLGMAQHKTLAIALMIESIANLGLGILLVPRIGVIGVAWGIAIPLAASNIFFLPFHMCSLLKVPMKDFLIEAYLYPVLTAFPLAASLWAADRWIHATHFIGVVETLALGGVVYLAELALYYQFVERRGR